MVAAREFSAMNRRQSEGRRRSFSQPLHDTHRHGEAIASCSTGRLRDRHYNDLLDGQGPLSATISRADRIVRQSKARSAELSSSALPHSNHYPEQHQLGDHNDGSNRSKIGSSITVGSGTIRSGLQVQLQAAEGGYQLQASNDGTSNVPVGRFM